MSEEDFAGLMSEMDAYDQQQKYGEGEASAEESEATDSEESDADAITSSTPEASNPPHEEDNEEVSEDESDNELVDEVESQSIQEDLESEFLASSDDNVTDDVIDGQSAGEGSHQFTATQSADSNVSHSGYQATSAFEGTPNPQGQLNPQSLQGHSSPAAPGTPLSHSYAAGKKVGASLADVGLGVAALGVGAMKEVGSRAFERLSSKQEFNTPEDRSIEQLEEQVTNYDSDNDVTACQIDQLASELKDLSNASDSEFDSDTLSEVLGDIQTELDNGGHEVSDDTLKIIEDSLTELNENADGSDEQATEKAKALQELIEKVIESIKKLFSKNKSDTVEMTN